MVQVSLRFVCHCNCSLLSPAVSMSSSFSLNFPEIWVLMMRHLWMRLGTVWDSLLQFCCGGFRNVMFQLWFWRTFLAQLFAICISAWKSRRREVSTLWCSQASSIIPVVRSIISGIFFQCAQCSHTGYLPKLVHTDICHQSPHKSSRFTPILCVFCLTLVWWHALKYHC